MYNLRVAGVISPETQQHIVNTAFGAWLAAAEDDEDKAAVTAAVEAAAAALKALGAGPCAAHAGQLLGPTTALLKGEAPCQVQRRSPLPPTMCKGWVCSRSLKRCTPLPASNMYIDVCRRRNQVIILMYMEV